MENKLKNYLNDEHLSIGTREYLRVLNAGGRPVESLPVAEARKVLADVQAAVEVDLSGIDEREREIVADGHALTLHLVRPHGSRGRLPYFVFIHGGGWVLGDYPTHRRLVRDLVVESEVAAVFVDYTPSPEAKYPQAVDEIYAAVKWVAENDAELDLDRRRMALVGNSAGGNMALAAALLAKKRHAPAVRALVLLWPVTSASSDWKSYAFYGGERFLTAPLMKWMFDRYTTDARAREEILLSPVNASREELFGLPPTLIAVAENDILRDEGEAMGRRLDEAGVETTTVRFNGVIHDWGMLNGFSRRQCSGIVCADRPVPDDSPLPRSVAAGANRVHDGAGVSERPCRCCSARRHRPPAKWPGWRRYARSLPRCASADRRRFHDRCRKP